MAKKKAKAKAKVKATAKTTAKATSKKKVSKKKATVAVEKRQVNVSLDSKTISKLDKLAKKEQIGRSALITKLIKSA